jgi:hypothetical protein
MEDLILAWKFDRVSLGFYRYPLAFFQRNSLTEAINMKTTMISITLTETFSITTGIQFDL